ncbi:MAG: response regulator [Candidatus Pacebacteria bacterium]|nr:response regulator [Candidatus Paceibacterota bacterium]PIR63176.1 MAG: hypothetical protein COU64_05670 [Candidatus Pacebacteria bacterium CG10_big_fil_rev_8_21_14_0_10_40_26]PIZ78206.1 MAG: hypothetical protein COY01_05490 [Candidatus Pacebacteria bacterium CG_4_10_14_0_2_um_filter_40_20]PJA68749.1 MAG: hypothetical protein CO156_04555 [Candidatus Pacebacteria bacterium CG_4_9_14_3_um_filter_40_12]PJC41689.1 MAG: hypothetical protein CO041_03145 [Candidatus Pacebacteria bacterium CG_4_9_14
MTAPKELQPNHEYKVLLAEDHPEWIAIVKSIVEDIGGTLALTVTTLEEAMAAIVLIEQLGIDLVILGGSLGDFKEDNEDAYAILDALKAKDSSIPTIGLSGHPFGIDGVTIDLSKGRATQLGNTILSVLTAPENT